MKLLFAASDRDLLRCCTELLGREGYETDTAFDGVQALTKLSRGGCALVILSSDIQRVEPERIIEHCRADGLPVLELLSTPLTLKMLLSNSPANAYLELPFGPEELIGAVSDLTEKLASDTELVFDELSVKVSAFEMNGVPITAEETDVLIELEKGNYRPLGNNGTLVASLNGKFAKLGLRKRIEYRKNEGYRMVKKDE